MTIWTVRLTDHRNSSPPRCMSNRVQIDLVEVAIQQCVWLGLLDECVGSFAELKCARELLADESPQAVRNQHKPVTSIKPEERTELILPFEAIPHGGHLLGA